MDETDDYFFIKENVVTECKVSIKSSNCNYIQQMSGAFTYICTIVAYQVKNNILNQFKITKNNELEKLPGFSKFNYKNAILNEGIIKSDNTGKIILNCNKSTKGLCLIRKLKIVEDDYANFIDHSALILKYKDNFEVEYFREKKRYYFLEIYAKYSKGSGYKNKLTYRIELFVKKMQKKK